MLIARYPVTTPSQPSRSLALTAKRTDEAGIQYLQDRLQLSTDEVTKVHRKFTYFPEKDRIKSSLDGVKDHLKLSDAQLRKMILRQPIIISCSFDAKSKQRLDSVQNYLEFSDDEMRKMMLTHPIIFTYSFDDNIKPTLDSVRDHLKLSSNELRKILLRQPQVISCSFDDNIKPTLNALQDHLKLSDDELRKMILSLPSIINLNFYNNIKPTLNALQNRLKLSDDELRKLTRTLPAIISLNFNDNIEPTLDILQHRLKISDLELKKMVVTMPSIIGSSNIVPKLDWLQTTFDLSHLQLVELLNKQLMLMSVNLDKTLIPGVTFWRECFNDRTYVEATKKIISAPRELTQSNKRLQKRSALFKAHGIPLKLLWGKATYTDDRLYAWVKRHYGESLDSTELMTALKIQYD